MVTPNMSACPASAHRAGRRGRTLLVLGVWLFAAACEHAKPPAPPPPEVLVTEVLQRDVPIYGEWVGTTDGLVNAQIRPKVQGYLLSQEYQNGNFVRTGQLLFRIDPRQFQAALDQAVGVLGRAQAALGKTQLDVARYRPLAKEGAVSQQELDDAVQQNLANKAAVDEAQAQVEQAKLNLGWTQVTSPIDGIAGINQAQVGDLVSPTTVLTTVSQVDPIKVDFPISEQEYMRFARRINAREQGAPDAGGPPLTLILADGSSFSQKGDVAAANRQVDAKTGTILLQGVFGNPGNLLRPGQYAKIRAATSVAEGALLVPQRAVRELQGDYQVAVVGPDGKVSLRSVEPGERSGSFWLIRKGLEKGEHVVVEGLQKVRDGMQVVAKDAPPEPGEVPPAAGDTSSAPAPAAPTAAAPAGVPPGATGPSAARPAATSGK